MASVETLLKEMQAAKEIRFADLFKVCEHYFGKPRNSGSSHHVFRTPWPGDPRVNIQDDKGRAKPYQVRQVLKAITKLAVTTSMTSMTDTKQAVPMTKTLAARKPARRR